MKLPPLPLPLVLGCLAATRALAQVAAAPAAPTPITAPALQLDAVDVTGTRLRGLGDEKALPLTILGAVDFDLRDAAQPADLLTALPQITGLPGNETSFLGATARGDNAAISLRGLPSSDTLVLLDGRRLAPHPISQIEGFAPTLSVNVNQLPNRGLARIEVLRDGASSIYGSDAVAGVVNYVTRHDFAGTELALRYGATNYGGGAEFRATLTHGLAWAHGRAMFTADFYHRDPIFARDRPFSAEADNSARAPAPWNVPTNTTFNTRASTSEYGSFVVGNVTATDAFGNVTGFVGARPTGVPATLATSVGGFFLQPAGNGAVTFATTTPSRAGVTHDYYWNSNAYRVLQPKTARANFFANGEYDLAAGLTAFAQFSVYQARSVTYREPDGISGGPTGTDGFVIVTATNPFNPFGTRFWSPTGAPNSDGTPRLTGTPSAVSIANKRLADLDPRTDYVDDSVYRDVAGLRGKLADWTWEAALLYSRARVTEDEEGTDRKSLLIAALNQTDPAKAFNPFTRSFAVQNGALVVTGPYQNPANVTSTFRSAFVRDGITKLGSGDVRASGDLAPLWGGNAIGAAVGGEFRYEAYDDFRPPFAGLNPPGSGLDPGTNDFLGFSPNSDTHGNRHVAAAYAETVVPLVGHAFTLPLVRALEVSASARYERYSDFGHTTKPKYAVDWRPASWLTLRASYNEGFHAPNLAQLFTGTLVRTQSNIADAYRSAVTGLASDGGTNRRSIAAGNTHLQPETSTGKSAGFVADVPALRGLSLSLDYWEIRERNVVTAPSATDSANNDNVALAAATRAALAAGQNIAAIDLGSGTAAYQGDPAIVRLPVSAADRAAFAAYNAQQSPGNQRAPVGAIDTILVTYFNRAQQFANGFDFALNYRLPARSFGEVTFATAWTRLNDFHAYNSAGALRTELLETNSFSVGGVTPKWRGNASIAWQRGPWAAGLALYYVGRYTDNGASATPQQFNDLGAPAYLQPFFSNGALSYHYVVHDTKTYNAHVSYRFARERRYIGDTTVRLGVVNLLNAKPPLSTDSHGYDTSIYNVMARGLSWSLELTKRF